MMTWFRVGILTWYALTGNDVFCGGPQDIEPWIALDAGHPHWQCGDTVIACYHDQCQELIARDAGPLWRYHIAAYPGTPLIGDIVEHGWYGPGISAEGTVFNVSEMARRTTATVPTLER